VDLATIDMPRTDAAALLREYEERWRDEQQIQDRRIAAGYRALARGESVIELSKTVAAGGMFPNGLPKIAIARADSKLCSVTFDGNDAIFDRALHDRWWSERPNRGALVNEDTVRVPFPRGPYVAGRKSAGRTMVPIIPPRHRPRLSRLRRFHILWEVEEWEVVPPRDPALLRWIGGDLWAVLATWDLTDLERAVLGAGR
jgi:hypothetical protein